MDSFAFIIHPLDPKADIARRYPWLGRAMPESVLHFLSLLWPPVVLSHSKEFRSLETGRRVAGWLLACPLTTKQMIGLPTRLVYHKIEQTGKLAKRLGAGLVGLGAYTSVVGDGGETLAQKLDIPVTTGDSYTVALAIRAIFELGATVGIEPSQVTAAVVGATGAIGSACARLLARRVKKVIIVGRDSERLQQVYDQMDQDRTNLVQISTEMDSIKEAHLVISATSSAQPIIHPEHLRPGAVVCDVALPRDVSPRVRDERSDVLVVDGGLAATPGGANFEFDYRLPSDMTFACLAETAALALEGRMEDYTIGKNIELERIDEIEQIAHRHGFRLAEFRSFNQPLTDAQVAAVRGKVGESAS